MTDCLQLTERFASSGIESIKFTSSSTEANLLALSLACASTNRRKILVFRGSHYGIGLSFSDILDKNNLNAPFDFLYGIYNDVGNTAAVLSSIAPNSLAAILVEPLQEVAGYEEATQDFLHFLNERAILLGAFLIVDETISSRLAYQGISAQMGLKPDLVTIGGWISGGTPLAACAGRRDLFEKFIPSLPNSANNLHLSIAAAYASLELYDAKAVERLNTMGQDLRVKLQRLLKANGIEDTEQCLTPTSVNTAIAEVSFSGPVTDAADIHIDKMSLSPRPNETTDVKATMWISGTGSLLCVQFSGPQAESLRMLFWHHMLAHGILTGEKGHVALNLAMGEEVVGRFIQVVEKFVVLYRDAMTL